MIFSIYFNIVLGWVCFGGQVDIQVGLLKELISLQQENIFYMYVYYFFAFQVCCVICSLQFKLLLLIDCWVFNLTGMKGGCLENNRCMFIVQVENVLMYYEVQRSTTCQKSEKQVQHVKDVICTSGTCCILRQMDILHVSQSSHVRSTSELSVISKIVVI
eukprot:TRINITY_DN3426_c0_g1_i4.p11 TRINITY_DN3426_c0_g1~~TRINITY_DN3426_c0_g1_i4.p11  ORF type:complete len:160 (-),score=2.20 TRINITY_DN3426_c0_g1_i4:2661-3140(-)